MTATVNKVNGQIYIYYAMYPYFLNDLKIEDHIHYNELFLIISFAMHKIM